MANQTGIFISIRAWLPTGKTVDEQYEALSIVKTAHETSDYAPLLSVATIEDVKTETKTRRIDDEPRPDEPTQADPEPSEPAEPTGQSGADAASDDEPEQTSSKKGKAA